MSDRNTSSDDDKKVSSAPLLSDQNDDSGITKPIAASEDETDRPSQAEPDVQAEDSTVVEAKDEAASAVTDEADTTSPEMAATSRDAPVDPAADAGRLKRFGRAYWRHKLWTLPLTIVLLAAVTLALPAVRYPAFATFMTKDVTIIVTDAGTKQPVASAVVTIDGSEAMTDNKGKVMLESRVGNRSVSVDKRYYRQTTADTFIPIGKLNGPINISLQATGRQVALAVVNKISGKPIENALLKASGTEVKTDKEGRATLVLPADKSSLAVKLSGVGYNDLQSNLIVTETLLPQNTFQLTPTGKLYFLSKQSGKIDVVKTDLDGSNRQIVVAGTGREEDRNTVLLASRDWKYLALLSRRDSDKSKLYVIETGSDKMTVMDEGDANFQLVGWNDSTFVYNVIRNDVRQWQPNQQALKAFNAATAKLSTLDQTVADGDENNYRSQAFSNFFIIDDNILYTVNVSGYVFGPQAAGKNHIMRSIGVNGQTKKDMKSFTADKHGQIEARLYAPKELYYAINSYDERRNTFFEYEQGIVKPVVLDDDAFFQRTYATYLSSPSNKKVFWSEQRDGKDTFFTGNRIAEEQKQVAVIAENQVYGWYSDDYLLVSKNGSELYILPAEGGKISKVADYHRPESSFRGYGGGYGGL